MIISLIIVIVCFVILAIDAFYIYVRFKNSISVRCTVMSSEKVEEREDGFLTNVYWLTTVEFNYKNEKKQATLKTSTCCISGQQVKCLYSPDTDTIFRKRDYKKYLANLSPIILTVGNLFLIIEIIISGNNLDIITKINITQNISIILAIIFGFIGIGRIIFSIINLKQLSRYNTEPVECEVIDIVRKTSKHKENHRHTYYPIYKYTFHGYDHIVESKLGRNEPLKIGDRVTVPISIKKGGPVEYSDLGKSFVLGIMFIVLSLLIIFTVIIP